MYQKLLGFLNLLGTFIKLFCLVDNEKDFTEKSFSFFNSIPLLVNVPFYVIRDLNRYFEEKRYFAGTTIYNFNEPSEYLYIIINGEIEVRQKISLMQVTFTIR